MWAYGYSDPFQPNGPVDVLLGKVPTFREAFLELVDFVSFELIEAHRADWWNYDHFAEVIRQMATFEENGGLQEKPDNLVDTQFTDEIGEIEYFVVNV